MEEKEFSYQPDVINSIINKKPMPNEKIYDQQKLQEIVVEHNNLAKKLKIGLIVALGVAIIILSVVVLMIPQGSQIIKI